MNREEAKAEAEKIIQEIAKIVGSNCEHDSYCHESECNRVKGITFCKVDYETSRKLAILQVKGIISENHFIDNNYDIPVRIVDVLIRRLENYELILTELERTK